MQVREIGETGGILFAEVNGQRCYRSMDLGECKFPYQRPKGQEKKANGVAQLAISEFRVANPNFEPIYLRKGVSRAGHYMPEAALEPMRTFMEREAANIRTAYFAIINARKLSNTRPANMHPIGDFNLATGGTAPAFELELKSGLRIVVIRHDNRHWLSVKDASSAISTHVGAPPRAPGIYIATGSEFLRARRPNTRGGAGVYAPVSELNRIIAASTGNDQARVDALRAEVRSMVYTAGAVHELEAAPEPEPAPTETAMTAEAEAHLDAALATLEDAVPQEAPAPEPTPAPRRASSAELLETVARLTRVIEEQSSIIAGLREECAKLSTRIDTLTTPPDQQRRRGLTPVNQRLAWASRMTRIAA